MKCVMKVDKLERQATRYVVGATAVDYHGFITFPVSREDFLALCDAADLGTVYLAVNCEVTTEPKAEAEHSDVVVPEPSAIGIGQQHPCGCPVAPVGPNDDTADMPAPKYMDIPDSKPF